MENNPVELSLEQLAAQAWKAAYFTGQYYFKVNTGKNKEEFGWQPNEPMTLEVQEGIQSNNAMSFFHEYFHYIHEISTVLGNICFSLDLSVKAIYTRYFDTNMESCEHRGVDRTDKEHFRKFQKFYISKTTLDGSVVQDAYILRVLGLDYETVRMSVPEGTELMEFEMDIPNITIQKQENNQYREEKLYLGRFFLYEGLAYELERELERQLSGEVEIQDTAPYSEYTLLRLLAQKIYPGVTTKVFLILASLSLSFINSGYMFLDMLNIVKQQVEQNIPVDQVLESLRNQVRVMLFDKLGDFNEAHDEFIRAFEKRAQLHKAFSFICEEAKKCYMIRAEQPSIEVDLVFSGRYSQLIDMIPVCDFLYTFTDSDSFNRDVLLCASMDPETSDACKVLIAYDHYQKSHKMMSTTKLEQTEEMTCPFYACCDLSLRRDHEAICRTKPWRIFEISMRSDRQFCWYGTGVGEIKGHTEQ